MGQPLPAGGVERARDSEIGDQGVSLVEQDILRLDVAVDHSFPVRVPQRFSHFTSDPDGFRHLEPMFPGQPVAEGFSLDQWHDIIETVSTLG